RARAEDLEQPRLLGLELACECVELALAGRWHTRIAAGVERRDLRLEAVDLRLRLVQAVRVALEAITAEVVDQRLGEVVGKRHRAVRVEVARGDVDGAERDVRLRQAL